MTQVSNGDQYGVPPPADDMNAFYNEVILIIQWSSLLPCAYEVVPSLTSRRLLW